MELSQGDVVPRAVGSVNHDNVYGDHNHRFAELARLSPAELRVRYVGVSAAYDALHAAVDRHDTEVRNLGAYSRADVQLEMLLHVTDQRTQDALHLNRAKLADGSATAQQYVVAILNLERWVVAVGRAIEQHHHAVGDEAAEDPAALEIDRKLWDAPEKIGLDYRVDISGRQAIAR